MGAVEGKDAPEVCAIERVSDARRCDLTVGNGSREGRGLFTCQAAVGHRTK